MTHTDWRLEQTPWVPTRTLPEGVLFVAEDGTIYQVVLAGSAGFRKAKRWGGSDREAVALVPDSPLAYNYPVVERGRPLPRLKRGDLVDADGAPGRFVFPTEKLARTAAHLEEALAWQSGCMARRERRCWLLTDGLHHFRVYYYQQDVYGQPVELEADVAAQPYTQGPFYWAYLAAMVADGVPEPASGGEERTPSSMKEKPYQLRARKGGAMKLAVDIGYGYTKGVGPDGLRFSFPSVIGNAEEIAFNSDLLATKAGPTVHYGGRRFFYGEQALLQSRMRTAIFDRSRTRDEAYRLLFVAALAELARHQPDGGALNVVTGLPVAFFRDRDDVVISLEGEYRLQLDARVTFDVEQVYVVPQPFGSLFYELLNEDGVISNTDVEEGRVAVVDVGTFTTDFIVSDGLRYVQRFSGSIPVGWSEVLNNVQRELSDRYRLDLTLHEVDQAVRQGQTRVKGQAVSLQPMLAPAVREFESALVAKARDLWGEGVTLDAILVTGGAAQHMAAALQAVYPQARLVPDAFWANAEGFYRFSQRPATFGEV